MLAAIVAVGPENALRRQENYCIIVKPTSMKMRSLMTAQIGFSDAR